MLDKLVPAVHIFYYIAVYMTIQNLGLLIFLVMPCLAMAFLHVPIKILLCICLGTVTVDIINNYSLGAKR